MASQIERRTFQITNQKALNLKVFAQFRRRESRLILLQNGHHDILPQKEKANSFGKITNMYTCKNEDLALNDYTPYCILPRNTNYFSNF